MNRRYDDDMDFEDKQPRGEGDREISLGTSTILGIFFALALLCAVFFGFGYTMGRRSTQPPAVATQAATQPGLNTSKPTPDSLAPSPADTTPDATAASTDTQPADTTGLPAKPTLQPVSLARASAPPISATTPASGASAEVVQVAAVSHQQDAAILISALKQRGYTATARHEPQDNLLHIQMGPFANKKDADAMRDHLIADGYNAIVK